MALYELLLLFLFSFLYITLCFYVFFPPKFLCTELSVHARPVSLGIVQQIVPIVYIYGRLDT